MDINIFINRMELERQIEDVIAYQVNQFCIKHGIDEEEGDFGLVEDIMDALSGSTINLVINPDE